MLKYNILLLLQKDENKNLVYIICVSYFLAGGVLSFKTFESVFLKSEATSRRNFMEN